MWHWFRWRKNPVDLDVVEWQLATAEWFMAEFGTDEFLRSTTLVEPTNEFFPSMSIPQIERAEQLFSEVQRFAGMEQWPVNLQAMDDDPNPVVGETLIVQGAPQGPAGLIQFSENMGEPPTMFYAPASASDPELLAATFAHELAHYLTAYAKEEPPGGWELSELTTNFAAVLMGFGLLLLRTAFRFEQFQDAGTQGWRRQWAGYLSEESLVYSLALFCGLKGSPDKRIHQYCKSSLKGAMDWSVKDLRDMRTQLDAILSAGKSQTSA